MKRYYVVQLIIDIVMIFLGFIIYLYPNISSVSANMVFYTMMSVYAGLELLEYLLTRDSIEGFYLFAASAVSAFSGFFLKEYSANAVLSITLVVWLLMIAIIKIIGFENIYKKKTNLFVIKLGCMSAVLLVGLLVAVNIYYRISSIAIMLALMYISYGFLECLSDGLDYLSTDTKFLKE